MMPDLGKYADTVLSAYAASIILILALVGLSLWRSNKIKRQLAEVELRRQNSEKQTTKNQTADNRTPAN